MRADRRLRHALLRHRARGTALDRRSHQRPDLAGRRDDARQHHRRGALPGPALAWLGDRFQGRQADGGLRLLGVRRLRADSAGGGTARLAGGRAAPQRRGDAYRRGEDRVRRAVGRPDGAGAPGAAGSVPGPGRDELLARLDPRTPARRVPLYRLGPAGMAGDGCLGPARRPRPRSGERLGPAHPRAVGVTTHTG
jgi:hypothetical protein